MSWKVHCTSLPKAKYWYLSDEEGGTRFWRDGRVPQDHKGTTEFSNESAAQLVCDVLNVEDYGEVNSSQIQGEGDEAGHA